MLRSLRFARLSPLRKLLAVVVIATFCTLLSLLISILPPFSGSIELIDTGLYDSFYKNRVPESRLGGPVVIVAIDEDSIQRMARTENAYRWPWPREYWGAVARLLEESGAKVVVFDLQFHEPSAYNRESDDDNAFAEALRKISVPVIHAWSAPDPRTRPAFAEKIADRMDLGAVNVIDEAVVRRYLPIVERSPSLAAAAVRAARQPLPEWSGESFLLHYYGPNKRADGQHTFTYSSAFELVLAADAKASAELKKSVRDAVSGKIVLIGATASAAFDLKGSPLSRFYPGVECHATAIENLIEGRKVEVIGLVKRFVFAWCAALIAAAGALLPRTATFKLLISIAGSILLLVVGYGLFVWGRQITWLPLAGPLVASIAATVAGLTWTYLVEDRRRRVLLKFLAQYVSPDVAAELNRRGEISLGGVRREMTVMFTDIAGFTDLAELMAVEELETFMNFYLSEMSKVIFELNGTLDKYIGDAIMSFWNAPLDQPEHAVAACHAALQIRDREVALREKLGEIGVFGIQTRIGINTGPMVVGNLGSAQKVNYTVLGDSVILASRLEGANKIYGSQILVAQPTVDRVRDRFTFRKLDLLRVKGRRQPMPVYELLGAGQVDGAARELVEQFESALHAYERREWEQAERVLVALQSRFPDDGPTRVLLNRVRAFRDTPPPPDWDGVYVAAEK